MAIALYKGEEELQMKFVVDKATEISDLPTSTDKGANGESCVAFGSVAFVIEDSSTYMLDSDDNWTEVTGVTFALNR